MGIHHFINSIKSLGTKKKKKIKKDFQIGKDLGGKLQNILLMSVCIFFVIIIVFK